MNLKLIISSLFIIIFNQIIAQSTFENGMINYNQRAENAKGIIAPLENISKALSLFKQSYSSTNNLESAEYYLKSIYYKSTYCHPEGDKKRKTILEEGKRIGLQMTINHPNSPAIHYWYAVILGSWAKESGVFAAAKEGVIDKLKSECERVIELNKDYDNGSGYLFLGILHLDAPYIPFFLTWPDNDKAIELIEKSYKMNPNHLSTQYYYAKALNEVKRKDEAINILEKAIKQKPSPNMLLEETSEIQLCQSLLKDLKS